jgi:hypothetical protein
MNVLRVACLGLLLPWLAQPCLAASVKQFGATPLYLSVDDEGVVLYSDIAPDAPAAPASEAEDQRANETSRGAGKKSSRRTTPRVADSPLVATRDRLAGGVPTSTVTVLPVAMGEAPADGGTDEAVDEAIRPERRDGGAPPEDH